MNDSTVASASDVARALIVWSADPKAAAPVVEALDQSFELTRLEKLSDLSETPGDWPEAKVLLLYLSPVETLCRAMERGLEPSVAMRKWEMEIRDLLTLNRRNRRQVRLLDLGQARANPEAFRAYFKLDEAVLAEVAPLPAQDEIFKLMARHLLAGYLEVRRLLGELGAVSVDLTGQGDQDDAAPDAAFHAYRDLRQARQEADLLLEQTCVAQEEIETLSANQGALRSQLETAQQDKQKAQQETDLLLLQMQAAQNELEALSAELRGVQETLEAARQDARKEQQEAETYRTQLSTAQGELERQRRDWKTSLDDARKEGRLARQEAELLQARARAAQEELDLLVLRQQGLEQALEEAKDKARRAAVETDFLQAQGQLMMHELDELGQEREQLKRRLFQVDQGMESLQSQVAELEAERAALRKRAGEKDRSLAMAGTEIRDRELRLRQLTEDLDRVERERVEMARLAEERQQMLRDKETEIEKLFASKSLRLTAPLRAIRAIFR